MKKLLATTLILAAAYTSVASASEIKTLSFDEVQWGHLNEGLGDAGPRAADLWGDRTSDSATGFLVKFKEGFSSPVHIHNVSYRGVVISGLVHNDDPKAKEMWLPAGSFWTQPAGQSHITTAKGKHNIAYIEIDSGPYLIKPESEAFDNGERPINAAPSNFVWLNAADIAWLPASESKAKVAYLWGARDEDSTNGTLLRLPAGFVGEIKSDASEFHAVVIKGEVALSGTSEGVLTSGSYFGLKDKQTAPIALSADTDTETILYIRANEKYNLTHSEQ